MPLEKSPQDQNQRRLRCRAIVKTSVQTNRSLFICLIIRMLDEENENLTSPQSFASPGNGLDYFSEATISSVAETLKTSPLNSTFAK